MLKNIFYVSLMLLALGACATGSRSYTADQVSKLNEGQLVVLAYKDQVDWRASDVYLNSLNNEKPVYGVDGYLLPVGQNKLEVRCLGAYNKKDVDYTQVIDLTTQAHKRYTFSAKINSDLSCFIKVIETQENVQFSESM